MGRFREIGGAFFKKMYKPVLAVSSATIVTSSMSYYIAINDGSYKEGDKSNTPYAVEQYTSDVTIDGDGNITTAKTAQELWDQMLEDGGRVNQYLDSPEELKRLITAQSVTDYLDTRQNPDEEIDWEKFNKDVNSKEVQGIIKLKRAKEDGSISTLTYTDPETFESYIDSYNESGSEADKKKALSHFTLEKGYKSSNIGTGTPITAGTTITIPDGLGSSHTYMGWQLITSTTSMQYKLREQAGMNFDEEGFGRINGRYVIACTTTYGQVGDYIDFYQEDGLVIQGIIGDIKNQNDAGCNQWGHDNGQTIVEFVVDYDTWYSGGGGSHANPGNPSCHPEWNKNLTHAVNGGSYFDNPTFGSDSITSNGQASVNNTSGNTAIGGDVLKWPTEGGTVTSKFGPRNSPTAGASSNHKGIDIGIPTGTNIYATEAGSVVTSGYSDSAGYMVTIDHGNGYITKYMHNSELKVSVGDQVAKGQVIAQAGSTGISTGPHLHFQIEYNGTPVDPLSFKYDNGNGDGVGGIGSNTGTVSTTTTFYAKVATWNERTEIITSDDPEVQQTSNTVYNMTSTRIDYEQFVSGYRMPFDYLWALLVITQDKEFVFELADLIYDSEIEITVHDNLSINTNVSVDTYKKRTKVVTDDVNVSVVYYEESNIQSPQHSVNDPDNQAPQTSLIRQSATETGGPFVDEFDEPYTTTTTVITKTNTLSTNLTKANVWIVNYTQEFKQEEQDDIVTTSDIPYDDEENYPENYDYSDDKDTMELAENFRQDVQQAYSEDYINVSATVTSLKSEYYTKIVDRSVHITNTLETTIYISSPAKIEEKVEKDDTENNFVKILAFNKKARNNINSAASWLFEILEKGPRTVDMLDITKYLLYKTTGTDYGITEFDFSIYDPKNFKSLSDIFGGVSNIGGIQGQIYDFLLAKGVPPVGCAAILGNIENESSFNPEATNGTHTGLCQWSNSGRFVKLKEYANSKGTQWTDVTTQLEFMWKELESSYSKVKDVIMSAKEESDMEYATWYFGRHFEVYFDGSYEATRYLAEPQERYDSAKKWYKKWQENHTGRRLWNYILPR